MNDDEKHEITMGIGAAAAGVLEALQESDVYEDIQDYGAKAEAIAGKLRAHGASATMICSVLMGPLPGIMKDAD